MRAAQARSVPRLLAVAHGTASSAGRATTESLLAALGAVRPDVPVGLCFLDVLEPRLPAALDDSPTVVVPLLLSTGYHVQSDIPAALAGRPATTLARHLGPDERLTRVLADRLGPLPADAAVLLVGAGSTRPKARRELDEAAALLAHLVRRPVEVATMADDLPAVLGAHPVPLHIATYLLTEGAFVDRLRDAAGAACVSAPLGVHPALVDLVWARYDDMVR